MTSLWKTPDVEAAAEIWLCEWPMWVFSLVVNQVFVLLFQNTNTGVPVWKYCSLYTREERSNGYCMQLWEETVRRLSSYFHKYKKPCCHYLVADGAEPAYQTASKSSLIKLLYIHCSKTLINRSKSRSAWNCSCCMSREFLQCSLLFSSSWIFWWESLGWSSLLITKQCLDENICQPQEKLYIEEWTISLETGWISLFLVRSITYFFLFFFPFCLRS